MLRRILIGTGAIFALVLIGMFVWSRFTQWIPAGYVGVLFHANGGLERKVYHPQRLFIAPMTTLYVYPTMVRAAIYTNDPDEGELKAADAVQVTTNDNATTDFDIVVWYHINPDDVLKVFDNYRTQPIEQIQSTNIRAAVRQSASIVGTQYDAYSLMGAARGEASVKLTADLKAQLDPKGITIDRAEFAGAFPNQAISDRITAQVNAETNLNIAQIKQDMAAEQKTITVTQATAAAEAAKLKATQTTGKSLEILSIEADNEALKKWDGHVPAIQLKPGQNVVLTPGMLSELSAKRSQAEAAQ